MKGIVLAGTASSVGKTVATLAVIRALEGEDMDVQPAKAGPDFIDPSHHAVLAGRPSRTLDRWLQGERGLRENYYRGKGDVCVVEGVMGLYDGDRSSTAQVAETLDLPVVLVVDGSARMESVAASALGFRDYATHAGRDIHVAGIIAQRTHGGRHERGIREALPDDLTYFGRIPSRQDLEIPERHLGLHMGAEAPLEPADLDAVAEHLEVDGLVEAAREPPRPSVPREPDQTNKRVAIARDEAFRFVYPAVLERLDSRGEVVEFAPTDGEELPACDGVYLPGGYPELHADRLSGSPAIEELSDRAAGGLPILGECGGMMALAESLTTSDGTTHKMAGVLPADIRMHDRFQSLDHVELKANSDTLIAGAGESRRGHEYHYSSTDVAADAKFAFEMLRGDGIDGQRDGLIEYATLGTYSHLHADSGAFDTFIEAL